MTAAPAQDSVRPLPSLAIVDDQTLVAESLALALRIAGFDVHAVRRYDAPGDVGTLVRQLAAARPALVLVDLGSGEPQAKLRIIAPLSRAGCTVVVLAGDEDADVWGQCLAEGAATVLTKSRPLDEFIDTLQRVAAGDNVIPDAQRDDLVRRWRQQHSKAAARTAALARLTPRESYVLLQLLKGRRVPEISRASQVSVETVRSQVRAILHKLGVNSQLAAVAVARHAGWELLEAAQASIPQARRPS